ncbi:YceI family protein [Ferruginibacter sp.]|uniref:YceI family protein n=1 Tax=Ferruginibacter sp. TaxID=1940288 RepID=UPI0019A95568|nr:YceI family protein [Ferruginibacter sp.]MBC7625667.1 YceI family protein [Ferruginibacter sp.]
MATRTWAIDPSHSEVHFKIKHLMITNVTGSFNIFQASVVTEEEDFSTAKISFTADVNSVDTGNEQRDGHLKGADFFDGANYPQLKFVATKSESVDHDGSYEMYGDLTIREITKNIKFSVEFGGVVKDAYGNTKAGFTINGKINRKDFGLTWSAVTEAGGIVLSDELKIISEIQLIEQA